jgi:hypothetical protein
MNEKSWLQQVLYPRIIDHDTADNFGQEPVKQTSAFLHARQEPQFCKQSEMFKKIWFLPPVNFKYSWGDKSQMENDYKNYG